MLKKLDITGVHSTVDKKLHRYILKKIGGLDKYIARQVRGSAHAEIKLKESKAKDKNQCTCEVIMHLPNETITIRESTINMFAAVDIAEEKLKNQLRKYKELHSSPRLHQRVIARLKRRPA